MKKRVFAIFSIFIATIILVALVPGCDGVEPEEATIQVEATVCGEVYTGAMAYTLSAAGEDPQNGTVTPGTHTVAPGEWTIEVSFGPAGALLVGIDPAANQTVAVDGTIKFTVNFEAGQDAEVNFITWTIDGQPAEFYNYMDPFPISHVVDYGSVIDVHFEQVVHGCDQHVAVVNETASLLIFRVNWMEGIGPDLEPMPFLIHGVNDDCAVNKTGDPPADKAQGSQELTWWSLEGPVSMNYCDEEETLWFSKNTSELLASDLSKGRLFEETSQWTVAKNVDYIKSINWLSVLPAEIYGQPEEDCVLLHLVPAVAEFPHMFLAMAFLSVEIQDAEDINPANNTYEGYYSPLVFWVPFAP